MGFWSWESSFWSAIAYELPGGRSSTCPVAGVRSSRCHTSRGSELAGVSTRLELYWGFGTWLRYVSLLSIEFRGGGGRARRRPGRGRDIPVTVFRERV